MVQSVEQLKQWFEQGDYPTQQQFWDWLDSFVHKNDNLQMEQIAGLVNALAQKLDLSDLSDLLPVVLIGQNNYTVDAGFHITAIKVIPDGSINFSCGKTPGGEEVIGAEIIFEPSIYRPDVFFATSGTLYFNGVTPGTIIKIQRL